MILDIICGIVLIGAFYNGYSKGIIYSVLSLVAILLGIVVAMNFSSIAAIWLHQNFNIPAVIMPALSFILVLVAVVAAVKIAAMLAEKFLQAVMLNFVNKLAGGVLWSIISFIILSVLVFFVSKTGFLTENLISESYTYNYLIAFGPKTLALMQGLIPYLKESFQMLNDTVQDLVPAN